MAVDNVGLNVPVNFGDSMSNSFRDIRGVPFVSDERTNERDTQSVSPKTRTLRVEITDKSLLPQFGKQESPQIVGLKPPMCGKNPVGKHNANPPTILVHLQLLVHNDVVQI